MANEHYIICESKKRYFDLGDVPEYGICRNLKKINKQCEDTSLQNSISYIYRYLCVLAFMEKYSDYGCRIIHFEEWFEITHKNNKPDPEWVEDTLD